MNNKNYKILLYHGVSNYVNYKGIENFSKKHISKNVFYRQMKFIKKNCNIISINDLEKFKKEKKILRNSVLVTFDELIITYVDIINHFWTCHDSTQLNQQGPDIGTQYRSVIYFFNDEQKKISEDSRDLFQKKIKKLTATQIIFAMKFYLAEEYHQSFLKKRT